MRHYAATVLYGRNDIENGYAEAVEDLTHYYVVGYYRKTEADGTKKWHNLEVRVARKDVRVLARSGFFAVPEPAASHAEREYELAFARSSPVELTALPFRVRLEPPMLDGHDTRVLQYTVALPPGTATIDVSDNNHVLFDIATDVYNDKGERILKVTKNLESRLKPGSVSAFVKGGMTFSSGFEVEKGAYTIRFLVRDVLSGRMGSVTTPITIQ